MRIGAVLPPTPLVLTVVFAAALASCATTEQAGTPSKLNLDVALELDTRAEDLLPDVLRQFEAGKIFSAEATLEAFLRIQPSHLEATTLLAYFMDETADEAGAKSAWADVEALLVYKGKLQPFLLQVPLFAGARHYLREHRAARARLFHDELWRRFPSSLWSQRTYLEMAEAAADGGRWVKVDRVCQDMLRMGAQKVATERCRRLLKVSAVMRRMGPAPTPGSPTWTWLHPTPQGNNLNDLWTGSDGELVAVGERGAILHRAAGSEEWKLAEPITRYSLRAVHGASRDALYAVGEGGIVLRFDGSKWGIERAADPVRSPLASVYSGSKGRLAAVSLAGEVLTLADGQWTVVQPVKQPLYGVWGNGSDDLYAVGKGGLMLGRKNGAWTAMKSDSYEDLWGIWGHAGKFVAVGSNRTVVEFNGGIAKEAVAGLTGFRDVWGLDDGQAWAVGIRGNIIHRKNLKAQWTNQRTGINVDLFGVAGTGANTMVAVGQGGTLVQRDRRGKWRLAAGGSKEKLVAVAPDLGSGKDGIAALGQSGNLLIHGDKGWKTFKLLPRGRYRDLCAANGRFAAVGDRGLFMVFEDKKWHRIKSGTSEDLLDVDGCHNGTLVAVGSRGVAVRYKNGKAKVDRTPTGHPLYGVWSGSSNNIWAVGGRGVTVHFDGKAWRELDTGQLQALRAVAMAGKQLMAVGEGGLVLNLDQGRWRPFESPTAQTLVALWGGPKGRLVAASQEGGILEHDGEKWVVHHSPAPCITSLSSHPTLGLLAVGCNRTVLQLSKDELK